MKKNKKYNPASSNNKNHDKPFAKIGGAQPCNTKPIVLL